MSQFSNLGDEIRNTVQEAVDSMNFDHLSRDISDSVRTALDEVKSSLKGGEKDISDVAKNWKVGGYQQSESRNQHAGNTTKSSYTSQQYHRASYQNNKAKNQEDLWEKRKQEAIRRAREMKSGRTSTGYSNTSYDVRRRNDMPIIKHAKLPGRVSGAVLQVIGYPMAIGTGIATVTLAILANSIALTPFIQIATGLGIVCLMNTGIVLLGRKLRGRVKRFKQYAEYIGNRKFCEIRELSSYTGYSEKYIKKDIRKMLQLGMFREAHLDNDGKYIIVDRDTYQQYLNTVKSYEANEEKKQEDKSNEQTVKATTDNKNQKIESEQSEELRKTIAEGREYIRQIKEANDLLPGEDISAKLSRLEQITSKIFSFVEAHPDKLAELRKFMEYYLPITLKLVLAYKELDSQPINGNNIANSKREIIATLDTINYAFENLLDSLYQSTAMDVSSDISVLEALFAQDGLTNQSDFKKRKGDIDHE